MTILAVDTTSEFGSLAIRSGGRTIAELTIDSRDGFAHLIFGAIEEILGRAGLALGEIECFAAASGPGSFTGVRVGLSAVKGLAEATGKPVVGVSNLRAVASFGKSALRAVVLDARRGEVYAAVYDSDLKPVVAESVSKLSEWRASLPPGEYEFVDATKYLAAAIAVCAEMDLRAGVVTDPAALDANYVRRSDAELFWKE